jgi:hypothetical protein
MEYFAPQLSQTIFIYSPRLLPAQDNQHNWMRTGSKIPL